MEDCIFCKIASKAIPVTPIYEDEGHIAFHDLHPQAPIHALVIPKKHYATMLDIEETHALAGVLRAVQATAKALNLTEEGFRTVINTRDNGGQTVYHVHFHILGGRFMQWPPG